MASVKEPIELEYIGGGRWIPGVPASDHAADSEDEADRLVASGMYRRRPAEGAKGDR